MDSLLTHCMPYEIDPAVPLARKRVAEVMCCPLAKADGYHFALILKREPVLNTTVVGVVTLTESLYLTTRMTRSLGELHLEGGHCLVRIEPILWEREVYDEPLFGLILRVLRYGDTAVETVTSLGASELPPEGLVFATNTAQAPAGWPK